MLFEVKDSGKGNFSDVKMIDNNLTPPSQIIDVVKVNNDTVWDRYPFRVTIETTIANVDIVLVGDSVINVVDITNIKSPVSLGLSKTIPGTPGILI